MKATAKVMGATPTRGGWGWGSAFTAETSTAL